MALTHQADGLESANVGAVGERHFTYSARFPHNFWPPRL